ncbi:PilT/PilU family type 4a pilus ATPase [Candidatus Wolfebacteria bacterium]|nr:PilT/PilU family type 4a pilus ATPase [Candidatus Wolfebacteria bacterium]
MEHMQQLEHLIETVVKEGASDLHLVHGYRPTVRVSGLLVPLVKEEVLSEEDSVGFMEALLSSENREFFLRDKEIDFSYAYRNEARFRGNCYYTRGGIGIALRLIPRHIKTLEELNLPDALRRFTELPQGFFLVVGPVGQGKSTTLAAMIEIVNTSRAEHIVTIEDPIEYLFEPQKSMIDQREVRVDTADFHIALRQAFRQDIDVLLIGEMRSPETISAAVTAAETGHLVFSTLHTNNAAQTIDRIIDSFPASQQDQIRVQLAGSLAGIFSQRLIPRISGGLVPAYELLVNNNAVSNLIRERRTHEINTVIETGLESGMVDMNRSLAELVRAGDVTVEEARRHSLNPKVLEKML